jgi:hypothetical protein
MARVSSRPGGPKVRLHDDEVWALQKLLDGLEALIRGDEPAPEGPWTDGELGPDSEAGDSEDSLIAGLSWPEPGSVTVPEDPALQRLLPDAYPGDPEAGAEFRRYTDATLRDGMIADMEQVRSDLAVIAENGHTTLDDDRAQAWLRALNHGRLVMASRLGIVSAADDQALDYLDEDDPRIGLFAFYRWSGGLLADLLDALP